MNINTITTEDLKVLADYMDDEIRERLHAELSPCSPAEFLRAYLDQGDEEFAEILRNEFDFDV